MSTRRLALTLGFVVAAASASAQEAVSTPPFSPWLDVQSFMLYSRYRLVESSAGVVTSNHMQYKDGLRVRLNFDRQRRYGINLGAFSGASFISTWNNTGIGTGDADARDHFVKQLFLSAEPVRGFEGQVGGLYVVRGQSTEYTTYDEDGYVVGERLTVRRPKQLVLDEITVTRGMIGPFNTPSLWDRRRGLAHPNYTQVLAEKRFGGRVAASLDYSTQSGADTVRGAVSLRFGEAAPVSAIRYEQYRRVTAAPAAGFAIAAERSVGRARVQGGYVTIDERYGGWNADRIQRGRRLFAIVNVPIAGPLAAQVFATRAFAASYSISNRTRFDAVLSCDLKKLARF